jgi:hypothetical protein
VLAANHVVREVAEDMIRSFAKNISHSRDNTVGLRSPRMFRYRMQRVCHENY